MGDVEGGREESWEVNFRVCERERRREWFIGLRDFEEE